jgi:tetratricopeptide (TPR) repeat protein
MHDYEETERYGWMLLGDTQKLLEDGFDLDLFRQRIGAQINLVSIFIFQHRFEEAISMLVSFFSDQLKAISFEDSEYKKAVINLIKQLEQYSSAGNEMPLFYPAIYNSDKLFLQSLIFLSGYYFQEKEYDKFIDYASKISQDAGEAKLSLDLLKMLLDKDPQHYRCQMTMGLINVDLRYYQKAEQLFMACFDINSADINLLNSLSLVHYRSKNFRLATEFAEMAIAIDKTYSESYAKAALSYLRMEDFEKAKQHLETYIHLALQGPYDEKIIKVYEDIILFMNSNTHEVVQAGIRKWLGANDSE